MDTKKRFLASLLAAVLCASGAARAADVTSQQRTDIFRMTLPLMSLHFSSLKNVPMSVDAELEQQRILKDGSQTANTYRAKSYRDSAGRVRHELIESDGTTSAVVLRDGDGSVFYLNPKDKTGLSNHSAAARAAAAKSGAPDANGKEVLVKSVERSQTDGSKSAQTVTIRVAETNPASKATTASPTVLSAIKEVKWREETTIKTLRPKEIDGIMVRGMTSTYEIPAGENGNRDAIVVSSETWRSNELGLTMYSRYNDPRTGERIWRLSNVRREEPDASLFSVPSDYAIQDMRYIPAPGKLPLRPYPSPGSSPHAPFSPNNTNCISLDCSNARAGQGPKH